MIRETYFFRNLENLQTLEMKTKEKIENKKIKSQYEIIDTIELTDKEFGEFSNDFKHNYKFLYKYIDDMKIDSNGVWKCVQIKNGNKNVLVHNSGYSYPRFTGLIL